jgi:hypothetical protein
VRLLDGGGGADDAEHAAGEALFGAVGEVFAATVGETGAGRAVADERDGRGLETGVEELMAVGFPEVEVDLRAEVGVAGGAGGEEEHGVFFADGIGVVDLGEEAGRIGELTFELVANFFSDGKAAGADGGADGGDEVLGAGAEVAAKGADAALDDAGESASPAGMEGGDGVGAGVGDEDRDAVGGEDAEEKVGVAGVECVAPEDGFAVGGGEWEVGAVYALDDPGVALADGDEVGRWLARFGEGGDQALAGGEDGGRIVLWGVAEVLFGRAAGGVGGRETTLAGAEPSNQPGVRAPAGDGDDARVGSAAGDGQAGGRERCVGVGWWPWGLGRWSGLTTHRKILQG